MSIIVLLCTRQLVYLLSCFIRIVAVVHRRCCTNVSQCVTDGCVEHGGLNRCMGGGGDSGGGVCRNADYI